ncbi:MAG: complex I NDUFA9 subunit family protein [Gammaproteobacteria bacterium]
MGTVAILGGTGFIGSRLCAELAAQGWALRVATRRRARADHLRLLPASSVVEADVNTAEGLAAALDGVDAAVNLVGILNERGDDGRGFQAAHAALPAALARACVATGVHRVVHMSALGAGPGAPSHYLRSKAAGEAALRALPELELTVLRPSVVFGPGDSFFNRFAGLLRLAPGVFPLACAGSRFAPVYVGDVARAFAAVLASPGTAGHDYDLCGPHAYTLGELVRICAAAAGLRRLVIGLPAWASWLQAQVLEFAPGKPFSRDNYRSLGVDNVCTGRCGLRALGIEPTAIEAVVPDLLARRPGGRYGALRRRR